MERYANLNGNSSVAGFENGFDQITVWFRDGSAYLYTAATAGQGNVAEMQRLALAGRGLNGFINSNVKYRYERRIQ